MNSIILRYYIPFIFDPPLSAKEETVVLILMGPFVDVVGSEI